MILNTNYIARLLNSFPENDANLTAGHTSPPHTHTLRGHMIFKQTRIK